MPDDSKRSPNRRDGKGSRYECAPLLQSAHLEIYRENPFRITGLPIRATNREIGKRAEKLKMMGKLGFTGEQAVTAFALDPPPSADQIRDAILRLKDPEQRVVDEFFWFWPTKTDGAESDPALDAIAGGDSDTAYKIWRKMENQHEHDFVASHNIAVMFHLLALDWSRYQLEIAPIDAKSEEVINTFWVKSFRRWEKIATDDNVWGRVKERIRELDDPRLTSGFARRMRDALPEALDKINGEIALRFAEQGDLDWASIHVDFMNETLRGLNDVEKTCQLVLRPTRDRVLQHISTAKELIKKDPTSGAEAAVKLIAQCDPLQTLFELFYGEDAHQKTELFDEVAACCADCAIACQRATNDSDELIRILRAALPLATSMEVRQRIRKNIEVGEGNVRRNALEPFLLSLKEIQDSDQSTAARLATIKNSMVKQLASLMEDEGVDSDLVIEFSNSLAIVLRGISIDAHNAEKSFDSAAQALRLGAKLAREPKLKRQIAKDLASVEESLEDANCYFCGDLALRSHAVKIPMHGEVTRRGNRVNYKMLTITVGQCGACHRLQKRVSVLCGAVILWGILLGALIGYAIEGQHWFIGGTLGGILGWLAARLAKKSMYESVDRPPEEKHPKIRAMLAKGWNFGNAPGQ